MKLSYINGVQKPNGLTPLCMAILEQDFEMVKLLVEFEADVNQFDPVQQMSPLFLAIKMNNHQITDFILKHSK